MYVKLALLITCLVWPLSAAVYQLPEKNSRLIGEVILHKVEHGDYFQQIAEYYNVGLLALIAANPNIDPFLPVPGTTLIIPKQMIMPFAQQQGIVINLAELRLYYFPPNKRLVYVFPVGIGKQGLATPNVISVIGEKRKNPTWRPTEAMRERYKAEHGKDLAKEVPPGPDNPFGKYALRLGTSEYLIHGSNKRMGIGLRASSGCIRMYDEDIEWLYYNVASGTQVRIIDQPVKMSYEKSGKWLEVHQPLSESSANLAITPAIKQFLTHEPNKLLQYQTITQKPDGLVHKLL